MNGMTGSSPALEVSIQEVQARFPDDAALQGALEQLGFVGYDRADFSLPEDQAASGLGTSNDGSESPADNADHQQLRTMGSSMAGTAAAFALAGATIATGGAAGVAALGAAAVGVGATAAASAAGSAFEKSEDHAGVKERDQRGAEGVLLLAIRTQGEAQVRQVTEIVRAAGAIDVHPIARSEVALTAGISSASWTGS